MDIPYSLFLSDNRLWCYLSSLGVPLNDKHTHTYVHNVIFIIIFLWFEAGSPQLRKGCGWTPQVVLDNWHLSSLTSHFPFFYYFLIENLSISPELFSPHFSHQEHKAFSEKYIALKVLFYDVHFTVLNYKVY